MRKVGLWGRFKKAKLLQRLRAESIRRELLEGRLFFAIEWVPWGSERMTELLEQAIGGEDVILLGEEPRDINIPY